MPLPPSPDREALHLRKIDLRGYRRSDGLYDIEARMTDTKTHAFKRPAYDSPVPAGEALHDMWVRLVVDDEFLVHDVIAATDVSPFPVCREAVDALTSLKGLRIGAGFQRAVRERLSGAKGCTHLMELLVPLATTAFQTLAPIRLARPDKLDANGRPVRIDSCYGYA
ncbi:MAG: DUF2889 domain-containing protein, partial [Burkholderiales bacterium]